MILKFDMATQIIIRLFFTILIFAICYTLGAYFSYSWALNNSGYYLIYPSGGLLMGIFLITNRKHWSYYIFTVILINFLFLDARPHFENVIITMLDISEASIGTFLINKYIGHKPRITKLRELTVTLVFALIYPLILYISIGLVTLNLITFNHTETLQQWWTFLGSNITGIIIFTIGIIVLNENKSIRPTFQSIIVTIEVLLIIAGFLVFANLNLTLPFSSNSLLITTPFIIWALFRFELRGAVLISILGTILLTNKWAASNLIQFHNSDLIGNILIFQVYISFVCLCLLIAGALISGLVQTRRELFQEKRLLEVLMDEIPDTIYFKDKNSRFTKINRAQAATLGIKNPMEAIGKSDADYFPDDQSTAALLDEKTIIETGIPLVGKIERVKDQKQGWIWMSSSKVPFRDQDNQIVGLVGISKNITKIIEIENELRKSEEKFRLIFDGTPVGIFQFDQELNITECNERFVQIFNINKNHITRTPVKKFFDQNIHQKFIDALMGEETNYEGFLPLEGGIKERWILMKITPLANNSGGVIGGIGIVEDITSRKRMQEDLIHSEKRYQSLVAQAKDGIFISGSDGNLEDVNEAGCEMLGYNKSDLLGKSLNTFMRDDPLREKSSPQYNKLYTEKNFIRRDKSVFPIEITSQVLEDGGFLMIARDISDRKSTMMQLQKTMLDLKANRDILEERSMELMFLSDQLAQSEKELKEINAGKDRFFSIVAHDLKSPFSGLLGYSDILVNEFDNLDLDEIKQYSINLDRSIKNVFKLIENLLEWSRLQTGRMKCNIEKIDLYESTLYIVNLVSANAENKGINITHNISPGTYLKADEHMLNSILENLLSNAIKFTRKNGKIELVYSNIGAYAEITVQDNGIGISSENLNNLFRIDINHSTIGTEQEKGTGLGLVICKEMIELQGGKIRVESELNAGSKFCFILPEWDEMDGSYDLYKKKQYEK